MKTQWHGWHLSAVENHMEVERLGSVMPGPVENPWVDRPASFKAAGPAHFTIAFPSFAEAQDYLDGAGNRAPKRDWAQELYA